MKTMLAFSDVLLTPRFSTIRSRADVDTSVEFLGLKLKLGIISSNMDSVTGSAMARAIWNAGSVGCLHRFWSVEDNVAAYLESPKETLVSVGVGEKELERAKALYDAGARRIVLDLAHGASTVAADQVIKLRDWLGANFYLVVGNFATKESILAFKEYIGPKYKVDAFKVGIGGGSACITRQVTGVGIPTLASILDCKDIQEPIIADGGITNSGDMCKAIAGGASVVMLGGMLAGAAESAGESYTRVADLNPFDELNKTTHKKYRGSASASSYESQGKVASHRTSEGESFLVPYSGPVANTLQQLEAGLRSSMAYIGAKDLYQYRWAAEFVQVSAAGAHESTAHRGK